LCFRNEKENLTNGVHGQLKTRSIVACSQKWFDYPNRALNMGPLSFRIGTRNKEKNIN
jgi:hypothetical protein